MKAPMEELPEHDEKQLCTNCLASNNPVANFCNQCGAPISPFASILPFERLFSEGFTYRQATGHPRRLIVVFGMWLIFGLPALAGLVFLLISLEYGFLFAVIGFPILAISAAMIWQTTRNYLKRKPIVEDVED